jgi:ubiquinone/menaquinone biosynthesis C-methylase UbiE
MKQSVSSARGALSGSVSAYDKIHFSMISLVHDKLYGLFVNPYQLLLAAGLRSGQSVLEVGCGPGFFTVPAAKIVRSAGRLCALDINPVAVQAVQRRIERSGLTNVRVVLADAQKTRLPDASYDVVFLFGVFHDFPDASAVVRELHRLLKPKGILSIQKSRRSGRNLIEVVTSHGLFCFKEEANRIFKFGKE